MYHKSARKVYSTPFYICKHPLCIGSKGVAPLMAVPYQFASLKYVSSPQETMFPHYCPSRQEAPCEPKISENLGHRVAHLKHILHQQRAPMRHLQRALATFTHLQASPFCYTYKRPIPFMQKPSSEFTKPPPASAKSPSTSAGPPFLQKALSSSTSAERPFLHLQTASTSTKSTTPVSAGSPLLPHPKRPSTPTNALLRKQQGPSSHAKNLLPLNSNLRCLQKRPPFTYTISSQLENAKHPSTSTKGLATSIHRGPLPTPT